MPTRIFLVPYPKIVFLYPVFLVSLAAAAYLSFLNQPLEPDNKPAVIISTVFLGVLAVNLVILAFDFPRTTSLTLFFFAAAIVMGGLLWVKLDPEILPYVAGILAHFHPLANATFYWTIAGVLGVIFVLVMIVVRFDYWEVRANELLHHHGFLANLERMSAPHLRIDKEINDVFEYLLLRSGRLILQPSNERRAIILDNVPFIKKKEAAITRMLAALHVEVRSDDAGH
ncbi:MAG: hypothetical protein ACUVUC_11020 [Thermoguttaceae bacterium]